MDSPKLSVKTKAGEIRVYENTDPSYPGVCVMLVPEGADYETDLMMVEVPEGDDSVNLYMWGNPADEDYTDKRTVSISDIADVTKATMSEE